ncbi:MAG: aminoglycoside phosphotransferase family protein [Catenulispora sp.]|nr:aminoglycoside phosphotransferase family protein [Catenulispora sp.]
MQRVPRLDVQAALDRIAEVHGVRLTFEGPCPGGEVGAAYVRHPDGTRAVLSSGNPRSAPYLAIAKAAGLPVPAYGLIVESGPHTVIVQELLPGRPPEVPDAGLVAQMLDVHDGFAGLMAGVGEPVTLYLRTSGPGFCLHETLAAYSPRTRRLLERVREVGAAHDFAYGEDLVHLDYHCGNVLTEDGRLTGVVDWDGAGRGDRAIDLMTLRYDLALRAPHLAGPVDERLAAVGDLPRLAYAMHMGLRLVDWSIRHHGPADVEFWLDIAERWT